MEASTRLVDFVLILSWLSAVLVALPRYRQWANSHPLQVVWLVALALTVAGVLGDGFGLANLFWHEGVATQMAAGASLTALALVVWLTNEALHRQPDAPPVTPAQSCQAIVRMFVPLGILLAVLAISRTWQTAFLHPEASRWWAHIPLPFGAWAAAALACGLVAAVGSWGAVWTGVQGRHPGAHLLLLVALSTGAIYALRALGLLTAVMAVLFVFACLQIVVALCLRATEGRRFGLIVFMVFVVLLVGVLNGYNPHKQTYPGLEDHYTPEGLVEFKPRPRRPQLDPAPAPDPDRPAIDIGELSGRFKLALRDAEALERPGDPVSQRRVADLRAEDERLEAELREKKSAVAHLARAAYLMRYGDASGAFQDASRAADLDRGSLEAINLRTRAALALPAFGSKVAETLVERQSEPAPPEWVRWAARGYLYSLTHDPLPGAVRPPGSGVAECYRRAIELHPGTTAAALRQRLRLHDELTEWYRRQNDARRAEEEVARANRLRRIIDSLGAPAGPAHPFPAGVTPLIDDRACLQAWAAGQAVPAGRRPVLVLVATSGGGIAAAYWTAKCLTRIEAKCPEFPRRLRIVTGASGGMYGAGVYVARHPWPGAGPRPDEAPDDVAKDCITPVVGRMCLSDLPSIFDGGRRDSDRGRELELAWAANTQTTTAATFASLVAEEARGARPSLIVSPMLVEDAKFLLISNLDLQGLGDNEEFFKHFPLARMKFTVGTAVRMNAAFPYVSPAVDLPTQKRRRVVDAGFLDNYGVGLACDWLERHRGWLAVNTGGVVLVEIRAYPTTEEPDAGGWLDRIAAGWEFVGTPFEGLMKARALPMLERNRARVAQLERWFNEGNRGFFRTFTFECGTAVPLGWSLTVSDRGRLDGEAAKLDVALDLLCRAIRRE
jgi:hypothetical protein